MSALEAWVQSPLAGALGWALLHSLWEGAAIAALLAAALLMMRSPRARYAAACVAMLLLLGGFGVTFVRMMPESAVGLRTARRPAFPVWNVPARTDASGPSNSGLAAAAPWLTPFWIAGVWLFYLRHLGGWVSVSRLRRRGVCCAAGLWQQEVARLTARLRVSRPVVLLESSLAEMPIVLGHFRPFILMPVGLLAGLPPEQVEAILLHELAHIRRCDYLVNILQRSVEGLLFYHPAVWWISRVIRAERENCCDDVAVAVCGNAREYAAALAALEQDRWSGVEPAVAATGGNLVKRIRRLLYPGRPAGAWAPWAAVAILIFTAVIALAAWQSEPQQQSTTTVSSQNKDPGSGPGEGAAAENGVFRVGGGVSAPVALYKAEPEYSEEALKAKFQGTVVISTVIGEDGVPTNLKVVRPLGMGLDEKAIEAVQKWKFRPGMREGKPVAVLATIEVNFRLPGNLGHAIYPAGGGIEQSQDEAALSPPYLRWLNEDVVYIIAYEERAAFLKLTTDEERDKFIEQFWLRRDPTPGTPKNEFKQEHYRRIAYANKHFVASARQGWQTDRGHIYIIYGPPDEIEGHPEKSPAKPYSSQVWTYRYVEGIGDNVSVTFIDRTGTGDYTLAPEAPKAHPKTEQPGSSVAPFRAATKGSGFPVINTPSSPGLTRQFLRRTLQSLFQ